jgi:hypothetical protein
METVERNMENSVPYLFFCIFRSTVFRHFVDPQKMVERNI